MLAELPPDLLAVLSGLQAAINHMDAKLTAVHAELKAKPAGPLSSRVSYSVEEVAAMLSKTPYTVREWCREGRINATKRTERRGGAELWGIPADEVTRIKDEGLLPPDMGRNRG